MKNIGMYGDWGGVDCVAVDAIGGYVADSSRKNGTRVFRVGEYRKDPIVLPGAATHMCFSSDGARLARAMQGAAEILLHDARGLATPREPLRLVTWRSDGQKKVRGLVFTGDAHFLCALYEDKLMTWTTSGRSIGTRYALPQEMTCIAAPSSGRLVAIGGASGLIQVWDVARGAVVASCESTSGAVTALAFAPSGLVLAAAAGQTVCLWDTNQWRCAPDVLRAEKACMGNCVAITTLTFAPDGSELVGVVGTDLHCWYLLDGVWHNASGKKRDSCQLSRAVYSPAGDAILVACEVSGLTAHDAPLAPYYLALRGEVSSLLALLAASPAAARQGYVARLAARVLRPDFCQPFAFNSLMALRRFAASHDEQLPVDAAIVKAIFARVHGRRGIDETIVDAIRAAMACDTSKQRLIPLLLSAPDIWLDIFQRIRALGVAAFSDKESARVFSLFPADMQQRKMPPASAAIEALINTAECCDFFVLAMLRDNNPHVALLCEALVGDKIPGTIDLNDPSTMDPVTLLVAMESLGHRSCPLVW